MLRRTEGFTLLEVLVALAILSAVTVVALETIGIGTRARAAAAEHAALRVVADHVLNEAMLISADSLGRIRAVERGRLIWEGHRVDWERTLRESGRGSGLFTVRVTARGTAGHLTVSTLRNVFGELWQNANESPGGLAGRPDSP